VGCAKVSGGVGVRRALLGLVAQVHFSFEGKYGMMFSGYLASKASHLRRKTGQAGAELGWEEPSTARNTAGFIGVPAIEGIMTIARAGGATFRHYGRHL